MPSFPVNARSGLPSPLKSPTKGTVAFAEQDRDAVWSVLKAKALGGARRNVRLAVAIEIRSRVPGDSVMSTATAPN